eukprot:gene7918-1130_t
MVMHMTLGGGKPFWALWRGSLWGNGGGKDIGGASFVCNGAGKENGAGASLWGRTWGGAAFVQLGGEAYWGTGHGACPPPQLWGKWGGARTWGGANPFWGKTGAGANPLGHGAWHGLGRWQPLGQLGGAEDWAASPSGMAGRTGGGKPWRNRRAMGAGGNDMGRGQCLWGHGAWARTWGCASLWAMGRGKDMGMGKPLGTGGARIWGMQGGCRTCGGQAFGAWGVGKDMVQRGKPLGKDWGGAAFWQWGGAKPLGKENMGEPNPYLGNGDGGKYQCGGGQPLGHVGGAKPFVGQWGGHGHGRQAFGHVAGQGDMGRWQAFRAIGRGKDMGRGKPLGQWGGAMGRGKDMGRGKPLGQWGGEDMGGAAWGNCVAVQAFWVRRGKDMGGGKPLGHGAGARTWAGAKPFWGQWDGGARTGGVQPWGLWVVGKDLCWGQAPFGQWGRGQGT